MKTTRLPVLLATLVVTGASACGTASEPGGSTDTEPATDSAREPTGTEVAAATPRLALTHDGGVMVVDVASGEVVADEAMEGFVRVSPAGDGRHALVSGNLGWHVLDLGSWGHEHGDHAHHYTHDPGLTGVLLEAAEAGHVVAHDGITTLFDDGTGTITVLDPDDLADGAPQVSTAAADEAHHGVAVAPRGPQPAADRRRRGVAIGRPAGQPVRRGADRDRRVPRRARRGLRRGRRRLRVRGRGGRGGRSPR